MTKRPHLLVNALSAGSGGGYTVAKELFASLAIARPGWRFTLALIEGFALHEELRVESLPKNAEILWAPRDAKKMLGRRRYERTSLSAWAISERVNAVVQLNGMMIPGFPVPALCHFQDPWPYRSVAWSKWTDPVVAFAKRRQHRQSLSGAWATGFTSKYLRDLICGYHRVEPTRADVFYNGVPEEWVARCSASASPWLQRPMSLLTVSNVAPYKRQDLVIRAVAELRRRPEFSTLVYHIAGHCPSAYRNRLENLIQSLRLSQHVLLEGRVEPGRLVNLYSTSRAFVLMSVCESFGIPAVEAMSFGTPVITSDCCAMPEICGDAAILCPPDDLKSLVARLSRVLSDQEMAEKIRSLGLQRVSKFRWRTTAEQMAIRIEELVA